MNTPLRIANVSGRTARKAATMKAANKSVMAVMVHSRAR